MMAAHAIWRRRAVETSATMSASERPAESETTAERISGLSRSCPLNSTHSSVSRSWLCTQVVVTVSTVTNVAITISTDGQRDDASVAAAWGSGNSSGDGVRGEMVGNEFTQ